MNEQGSASENKTEISNGHATENGHHGLYWPPIGQKKELTDADVMWIRRKYIHRKLQRLAKRAAIVLGERKEKKAEGKEKEIPETVRPESYSVTLPYVGEVTFDR